MVVIVNPEMNEKDEPIWKNKARCKNCGDVLESIRRHDFITCTCFQEEKGHGIFIDGGRGYYTRIGGNFDDYEEIKERIEE